jgi:hypothetical protein
MKKLYVLMIAFATFSSANAQVEGTWKLANQAGALGVGPALGDITWWSNSTGDLATRACLFDDSVKFDASGSFFNYMDNSTWLEGWQGTTPEACGVPVAPHNGSNAATYTYNSATGELTVNGVGAHIGLAKVVNGAELTSPANAPASITYMLTFSNNNNTMTADISFGPGYWRFVYNRTSVVVTPPTPSNVTFKVNMSDYTGVGNIANGVFLNGTFNNWNGTSIPMTNVSGSNWEVTVPLAQGPIQYKFTVDGWSDSETMTAGAPCVDVVADGFDNRAYNVTADAVLPNVCWASCDACAAAPPSNVTFKVDMANYTGVGNIANGVFLNGTFNNWNGNSIPMTNVNGTNWEVTVPLAQGPIQYKFTVDGWSDSETMTAGAPCVDVVADGFDNRAFDVTADAVLPNVCWASCDVCPGSGITELTGADLLIVSPNPASNIFTVSFNENLNAVEVYDLSGKLVKSVNGNATEMNVSVESLEAGVYTVVVRSAKGDFSKKLIIE